ncbi:flavodoxin/nitric oxide synthase [Agromyces sp. MMS24-JH15]|uniref:flavodoxin/nitric oxide synthase n=1 Tax=Agromyces sp. MMS24-JH15 TaxID=3243765 RepID=UPI00374A982C
MVAMAVLVVVESVWGNTEAVARAIVAGLGGGASLTTAERGPSAVPDDVDLVVVGCPTHAFGLPSRATRQTAREQGATHVPERGVREWIAAVEVPHRTVRVATFCTKAAHPNLPGSASKKAMKRLIKKGFEPLAQPEAFLVEGYDGPLQGGEIARAEAWGKVLGVELRGQRRGRTEA